MPVCFMSPHFGLQTTQRVKTVFAQKAKKKKVKKGKNIYFVTIFNFHFKEKFIKIY